MSTSTNLTQNSKSEPSLLEQYQEYLRRQQDQQPPSKQAPQAKLASLKRRQIPQEGPKEERDYNEQHNEREHPQPPKRRVSPSYSRRSPGSPQISDTAQISTSVSSSSIASSSAASAASSGDSRGPPRTQLTETAKLLQLSLELPGIKARHIDVNVQHGVLVIKGHKDIYSVREGEYVVTKRYKFCRRFSVDTDVVDLTNMKANLNSRGILKITAPKKERPSRVSIPVEEGDEEDMDLATPVVIPEEEEGHPQEQDVGNCDDIDDDDDKTVVVENKGLPV